MGGLGWRREGRRMKRVEGADQEVFNLHLLPHLVILQICDTLGVEDVLALAGTNKLLHSFLNSCFIVVLQFPVPPALQEAVRTKQVLRLLSSCNLHSIPSVATLQPFASLNLTKLKELSLTGKNHVWNKQYLLSDQYKQALHFLLSTLDRTSLNRLEFLTDESLACVDLLEGLASYTNLSEVVVHGIGYFNPCASYHMDKEIAQKIINKVLANTNIKVLCLKSFQTINRCVVFESPSLERLEAELGRSFQIGFLNLPRSKEIRIDTSMWYGCFYHAQNGELKRIVNHGCPSLETFNGIDLSLLASQSKDDHWLNQLRHYSLGQIGSAEGQCVLCSEDMEM